MLQLRPDAPLPKPTTPYEEQALRFCEEWLSGKPTFTLHTSGSTGTPKRIELARTQMVASARLTGETFGLRTGEAALCCLNVAYVAGVMMLVRALELHLNLTVVEPASNPLDGVPETARFDFCAFVPLQLQVMLEKTPERLPVINGAKAILLGGAAVSGGLEERLQVVQAPVFGTYGMTETVSHVAIRHLNGPERSEIYRLLRGVEAGTDHRDCLWVRGPMTGFIPVQTNDVVEFRDAQTFRWLGRYDSIVNSGGVKIVPERVEAALEPVLRQAGFGGRFFVCGLPDERLGQRLTLVLEGQSFTAQQVDLIRRTAGEKLSRFELPKHWEFLATFPETPTGKIDRKRIQHRLAQSDSFTKT
jgi:O-succinylbenzoic acid--CoA ligase